MKILHCSDTHLGKKPFGNIEYSEKRYKDYFNAFENIVDFAIVEKIEVFMIAGDFFDKKELLPSTLSYAENILKKLKEARIKTLMIEGNHDNISKGQEINSWINYLEEKEYFKRLSYKVEVVENKEEYIFEKEKIGDINFFGLGYPGHNINNVMTELSNQLDAKNNNIVMVHTAIAEGDFLAGTVDKKTVELFKNKVMYIAGGHFHSYNFYPKEEPIFFIPGSPEFWNIQNEVKQKKGFIIFDTESKEHKFYPSKTRNRIIKKVEIKSESTSEFKEEFDKLVEGIKINKGEDIVIITLKLEKDFFVNIKECEERLNEKGALKSFIKVIHPKMKNGKENIEILTTEEIEEKIIKNWDIFGEKAEEIVEVMGRLKENQIEGNKDDFLELFDSMIEKFLGGEKNENK
ncbi:MAG: hypothetical protein B6I28_05260 [Fusobacteriia bacterium 4572_132]|nr:MAG: hypothetical protein B6I28_05260 [Fusobacteriia bacterium 4572_132]